MFRLTYTLSIPQYHQKSLAFHRASHFHAQHRQQRRKNWHGRPARGDCYASFVSFSFSFQTISLVSVGTLLTFILPMIFYITFFLLSLSVIKFPLLSWFFRSAAGTRVTCTKLQRLSFSCHPAGLGEPVRYILLPNGVVIINWRFWSRADNFLFISMSLL